MNVICVNPECPEFEVSISLSFELLPGEFVTCGACERACEPVGEPEGAPDA